jgi:adenylate kinase family enzyme
MDSPVQRVLVIGSPGSGKSIFATNLAQRTGLPLIHLDQQYWNAGWLETPKDEWRAKVAQLVAGDQWIIDGNYSGSLDVRLARADTVIQLDVPAWVCVARVLRRIRQSRGKSRADMAEGCPERLNIGFLFYIVTFPFARQKRVEQRLAGFSGTRIRLRGNTDVQRFLASVENHG